MQRKTSWVTPFPVVGFDACLASSPRWEFPKGGSTHVAFEFSFWFLSILGNSLQVSWPGTSGCESSVCGGKVRTVFAVNSVFTYHSVSSSYKHLSLGITKQILWRLKVLHNQTRESLETNIVGEWLAIVVVVLSWIQKSSKNCKNAKKSSRFSCDYFMMFLVIFDPFFPTCLNIVKNF